MIPTRRAQCTGGDRGDYPELARDGIELRKFGLQVVEGLAEERVHNSWIVPGGVGSPWPRRYANAFSRNSGAKAIIERTIPFFKRAFDNYKEEIAVFGSFPTMYAGLVDAKGNVQFYEGNLRFRASGEIVQDQIAAEDYKNGLARASLRESYLKAPYFKPKGSVAGVYRVGPLGGLNAADGCGTPRSRCGTQRIS